MATEAQVEELAIYIAQRLKRVSMSREMAEQRLRSARASAAVVLPVVLTNPVIDQLAEQMARELFEKGYQPPGLEGFHEV